VAHVPRPVVRTDWMADYYPGVEPDFMWYSGPIFGTTSTVYSTSGSWNTYHIWQTSSWTQAPLGGGGP